MEDFHSCPNCEKSIELVEGTATFCPHCSVRLYDMDKLHTVKLINLPETELCSLLCTICGNPIGSVRPIGLAWVDIRPVRMCNRCINKYAGEEE